MRTAPSIEFPAEQQRIYRKARRLAWLTIIYLISVVILLYLVLGSSQAMKAAWLEDLLSLVPPIAFLVATRISWRTPTQGYPYGYHRAVSIAYLCAALALFGMGAYLLIDSGLKLILLERPTIGTVYLFGDPIWLGWLMLPALLWSAVPPVFLGRAKLPIAHVLHDKVLVADAKMNKADWLTAGAAMVGVIGIGFGLWWADAVAAIIISLDVLHDGVVHTGLAVTDLADRAPKTTEGKTENLPERITEQLQRLDWVSDTAVRLREEGHILSGEGFVVPKPNTGDLVHHIEQATHEIRKTDWRLKEFIITPVRKIE